MENNRIYIDTNYFLRYLLEDIEEQHKKAKNLFLRSLVDDNTLFTTTLVIFEVYWVLSSFYNKEKQEIITILRNILKMKFVEIKERDILFDCVEIYEEESLDIEDCYHIASGNYNNCNKIATFDSKLSNNYTKHARS